METLCYSSEIKVVMNLNDRIAVMAQLGEYIQNGADELNGAVTQATLNNPWFTTDNINHALKALAENYLDKEALINWAIESRAGDTSPKNIGLILAGNIPMVGFHDLLSVFISGHKAKLKFSSKDDKLIPFLIDKIVMMNPGSAGYFERVEKMSGIDAIIATGSNSTGSYFEKYFGHLPHVIRKNRHAVAVLKNEVSRGDLEELGKDIFQYFGLGCRNVSKLYLEKGFDIQRFFDAMLPFGDIINHHKYKNNYDYNNALFLLNKEEFLTNNFLIVRESADISSRIASVHYEYFENDQLLSEVLNSSKEEIQCVVSNSAFESFDCVAFGQAQNPRLNQYADGVDTMKFLTGLYDQNK